MQNEIKQLAKSSAQAQALAAELKKLEHYMHEFRTLDKDVQSLQIQFVVDKMAMLYCALMLLMEGIDQQKTSQSVSKLDCFDYFSMLHFNKNEIVYDTQYVQLISRIIA
jgi:hypothetical protein